MTQLNEILSILERDHLFLTGGAGTGKSYRTNEIIAHYRATDRQVVALGSTGVSAVNIHGFTIHSFFAFGISANFDELAESDKRNRNRLTELKKILKATDLIVIDEISMVSSDVMEMILSRLENAHYQGRVMLVGDFYQLPPIVKKGRGDRTLFGERLYAFESSAWHTLSPVTVALTEMRRTHDAEFTHILSKIRTGVCDAEVERYCFGLANTTLDERRNPTHLYGRNLEVEHRNRARLNELPTEETILFATLTQEAPVHAKRLESWKKLLPVSEQLTLKVGVPILFTVNKWGSFVNGERGILHTIEADHLIVEKEDSFVRVERHDFDLLDMVVHADGKVEQMALATLSQFPLKLAYAVTIHKSQGMSIDDLVCNVDNIFAPSQLYVALSRATDPRRLRLDFSRGDLGKYLHRVIHVDERVRDFYE